MMYISRNHKVSSCIAHNQALNLARQFTLVLDVTIPHTRFCVFRSPSRTRQASSLIHLAARPTLHRTRVVINFQLIDHYRKHFAIFARFIGQPLQSLIRAQYLFDGEPDDEDDGSLEIRFANDGVIRLDIASDGESVVAATEPLTIQESFTIDEGLRCEWQLVELIANEPWSTLSGRPLSHVQAMVNHWRLDDQSIRYTAGWLLWFGDSFVGYFNYGDNSKLLFNQKASILADESTTHEHVAGENPV